MAVLQRNPVTKAEKRMSKALRGFNAAHQGLVQAEGDLTNAISEQDKKIAEARTKQEAAMAQRVKVSKVKDKLAEFVVDAQ
jgi:hypothetical protein